jgi:hypothetical protein
VQNALVANGAREVWLREEVERLGALIDAPTDDLVSFDPRIDMGAAYVLVQPGGPYHWIVKERGQTLAHRTTEDVDDILYWSFEVTTGSIAGRWAAQHPDEQHDFRVGMWAKQQELLHQLNPLWVQRWRDRLIADVAGAAALLPPV